MTGIFEGMPTPEEVNEALALTWEETASLFPWLIEGVNDALRGGKATHEEIITSLTFLVTGTNKIVSDLIQEGSRMEPRQNYQLALIIAQEHALHEMNVLSWRK